MYLLEETETESVAVLVEYGLFSRNMRASKHETQQGQEQVGRTRRGKGSFLLAWRRRSGRVATATLKALFPSASRLSFAQQLTQLSNIQSTSIIFLCSQVRTRRSLCVQNREQPRGLGTIGAQLMHANKWVPA